MPILPNPRHEAFAQAFVASLSDDRKGKNSATAAYFAAGYNNTTRHSAAVCAHRLLRFVDCIAQRIRELQQEALARLEPEIDFSRKRVGKRLDLASNMAQAQENPAAIVSSEQAIAKVFGHITDKTELSQAPDFAQATSLQDIGIKLLQSVGYASPSPLDVAAALDAHAEFTAVLEAIAERSQGDSSQH